MGKYNVNFSCGHTQEIELAGKYEARQSKIAYYEEKGICSECYAKMQAEKTNAQYDIIEVHYSEYKNNYADNKTVPNSYNKDTKTIQVYVEKVEEISEEEVIKIERALEVNTPSMIFKRAHKLAKAFKAKYSEVDYKFQFSLILKELYAQKRKCEKTLKELSLAA